MESNIKQLMESHTYNANAMHEQLSTNGRLQPMAGSQNLKADQEKIQLNNSGHEVCEYVGATHSSQHTAPDAKHSSTRCCPTHEVWELPTPLIVANRSQQGDEVYGSYPLVLNRHPDTHRSIQEAQRHDYNRSELNMIIACMQQIKCPTHEHMQRSKTYTAARIITHAQSTAVKQAHIRTSSLLSYNYNKPVTSNTDLTPANPNTDTISGTEAQKLRIWRYDLNQICPTLLTQHKALNEAQVDWAVKMRIRLPELETSICDAKYHVSLALSVIPRGSWGDVARRSYHDPLGKFEIVIPEIGSIATLDLPMVVDLIGIYGLKGPYCTLTTTNWFLQALSVIPRGSWGDVARRSYHDPLGKFEIVIPEPQWFWAHG
ncbi:cysteine-rich receptor-like protein kinase 41 [Dorcoceras hygrometricum]|uniref:Cysteine-rich receptor-like protein kinase 41 n=1 Tax=Dorcoceras hygrometricum TaxID=472368 RepID=A0A2Z7BT32_9LAMI|nr:cysteine-rich receptor-like protein kinase 41 [Dorcoceras hygrometricum]